MTQITITLEPQHLDQIADAAAQKLLGRVLSPVAKPFPKIGEFWPEQGGYLGAVMRGHNGQQDYCLIVSESGYEFTAEFGSHGKSIETSDFDGTANTKLMIESDMSFPAAEKCAGLTIEGHSDWFLAARREMRALASSSADLFDSGPWYWTSTQCSPGGAYVQDFGDGGQDFDGKDTERRVRPVRRLFI